MAPSGRTSGSHFSGLAAPPLRNNHFINWSRVYLSRLAKNSAKRTTDVPGPETGRGSLGDTDHYPAVIQDAFRQDGEDSAAGRLQTDRLVLRVGSHRFRHRAFPATFSSSPRRRGSTCGPWQGRALVARSRGVTPRLPRLEGRARDTSGPPGPSGFDP